jgi:hypothetical protein
MMAEMAKLSDAIKAKDAQYDALKETYERTNALVQTMMENGGRGGGAAGGGGGSGGSRGGEISLSRDYAGEFNIPNEAVQAIVQETLKVAETKFDGRFMSMQQVAKARDQFYKDNPDLVGSEFLVGSISQQVDVELPSKTVAEKFKEVADRARKYIKRMQDAHSGGDVETGQPVGAGGGSREGAGAGGGGEGGGDRPLTPDAELQAEVTERNKLRAARSRIR